jgi:hypothetical protein
MAKDEQSKKEHDETQDDTQKKELMDEQYEFGLNEEVREEIEDQEDDGHKEPKDKADRDDVVIDEKEVKDETDE